MQAAHTIEFKESGRGKAQCPADPLYPNGKATDCSDGLTACDVKLPYPATECGACGGGFRSMEQLNNWFLPTEQEKLKDLGYKIVAIEADKIIRSSNRQTVFWSKKQLRKAAVAA